jgi:hypothetical protein
MDISQQIAQIILIYTDILLAKSDCYLNPCKIRSIRVICVPSFSFKTYCGQSQKMTLYISFLKHN